MISANALDTQKYYCCFEPEAPQKHLINLRCIVVAKREL